MKDKKEVTNEDIKMLIDALAKSFEYSLTETSDLLKILGNATTNLGRRLEMLEDHVYNDMDDDEFLNQVQYNVFFFTRFL